MYSRKMLTLLMMVVFLFQVSYAQDGKITKADREFALNYLDETEQYLLNAISDISAEEWEKKPTKDRWSIAECAEHILLSQESLFSAVRNKILHSEAAPEKAEAAKGKEQMIIQVLNDRHSKRVTTSEKFIPKGKLRSKKAFIKAFKATRKEIKEYLSATEDKLRWHFGKTPFGEIDAYQNFILNAAHTSRHTQQIEEVRAALGKKANDLTFNGGCKVNTPVEARAAIKELFGELLFCSIESTEKYDRVWFGDKGFVVFLYADNYLTEEQHLGAMWAGLNVPYYQYESVKQRLKAYKVKELHPGKESSKYFYFHAPGGQVFRLQKGSKPEGLALTDKQN